MRIGRKAHRVLPGLCRDMGPSGRSGFILASEELVRNPGTCVQVGHVGRRISIAKQALDLRMRSSETCFAYAFTYILESGGSRFLQFEADQVP